MGRPPRAWRSATTALLARLGRSASPFVAEAGARCGISRLRALDDDRLRDLGATREDIEHLVRSRRD
jgi:uncharacterized protein YjiS (DUF1127 family)